MSKNLKYSRLSNHRKYESYLRPSYGPTLLTIAISAEVSPDTVMNLAKEIREYLSRCEKL